VHGVTVRDEGAAADPGAGQPDVEPLADRRSHDGLGHGGRRALQHPPEGAFVGVAVPWLRRDAGVNSATMVRVRRGGTLDQARPLLRERGRGVEQLHGDEAAVLLV